MKAKSLLFALAAASIGSMAYAYTEKVETMTVELQDGSKVEYKIENVAKVSFESREETIGFRIADANDAELYRSETVNPMFILDLSTSSTLLFGSAENAAELADLKNGKYMIRLDIANSAYKQPDVNIAAENSGVVLSLYEWTDGEISAVHENPTEGTLTTALSAKGVFTMELEAKFTDGLAVRASFSGKTTEISDLEVIFPTPGPKNEVKYYNADGGLNRAVTIEGFAKKVSGNGNLKYTATLGGDDEYTKCEIEMKPEFLGQLIDFATYTEKPADGAPLFSFRFDNIQLSSPNEQWRNQGLKGTMQVVENADGTITVTADVVNKYIAGGSTTEGGTPERVTIEYTGPCEGVEAAPKNNVEYYNADGVLNRTATIEGFTKKISGNGNLKYTATLGGDDEYTKCEIEMKPEFLGQLIDFADYTEKPADGAPLFSFRFDNIQLSSPNEQWRNQGLKGTMQVVENADGTITVTADVVNKYIAGGSTSEGGTPERVVIEYKGACDGL